VANIVGGAGNSVMEELLQGRKLVDKEPSCYTYDGDLMCGRRSFARDIKAQLETMEGELADGHCELCNTDTLVVPSEICVSCQVKRNVPNPIYVKKGCWIEECQARMQERCGSHCGLYPAGLIMGNYPCSCFKSSRNNEKISLVKRVFIPTPKVDVAMWQRFRLFTSKVVDDALLIKPFRHEKPNRAKFEKWNRGYPEARKKENEKAWASIEFDVEPVDRVLVKAFLKFEKDSKNGYDGVAYSCPRLIQPFEPIVRVLTGLMVMDVQEWFHEVIPLVLPGARFSAGDNSVDLSKWFAKMYGEQRDIAANDMTCYDACFHQGCHKLMLDIYRQLGCDDAEACMIARAGQVNPIGYTRHGLKYRVEGTMRSGAADTCLANSVVNIFMHYFALQELKLPFQKFSMAAMGDDTIVLSSNDLTGMCDILMSLGFLPKFQRNLPLWNAVYLNMLPYPSSDGIRFAPLIGRLLARLGWSTTYHKKWREYQYGVYKAFQSCTNHVPILRVLVKGILSKLSSQYDRGYETSMEFVNEWRFKSVLSYNYEDRKYTMLEQEPSEIVPEVWDFLSSRYGVPVAELQATEAWLETTIQKSESTALVLFHPVLERLCEVDL